VMDDVRPGARRSYWLREALARDPGEPCPPLSGDTRADVLILGGGYTGMWTAYFLTEHAPGIDVVVLEQDICGGGPSGRNGGFVLGWWDELPGLVKLYGEEKALEACRALSRSVRGIGEWCGTHAVDAWFTPGGYLGVSTSAAQDEGASAAVELARRLGVADEYIPLSPEQVQDRCRSPVFRGGAFMRDGATVQPARLARGLRHVLLERGVRIFEQTAARRFGTGRVAEAETDGGTVRAGQAVVALNAWAAAWKEFRRGLVTWGSYIVLTEPAPERLADIGWTGGECIVDFRTALHYLRTTPDGRIAVGGGGARAGYDGRIGRRFTHDAVSASRAAQGFRRLFPSFSEVSLEDSWGGPIDVSGSHLPYFGTLAPGNVHFGHGYTGNGVAPSHLAGQILASLAMGRDDEVTRLPMVGHRPIRFPPEPLKYLGAYVIREAIVRNERAEDEGKKPNAGLRLLAGLPRKLGYLLGPE
jgi:glycine/D-amino acid oxidase-like deaminating enzyme